MNEKGKISFSIINHICLQQAFMVHCTWCVHSVPAPCSHPSARSAGREVGCIYMTFFFKYMIVVNMENYFGITDMSDM